MSGDDVSHLKESPSWSAKTWSPRLDRSLIHFLEPRRKPNAHFPRADSNINILNIYLAEPKLEGKTEKQRTTSFSGDECQLRLLATRNVLSRRVFLVNQRKFLFSPSKLTQNGNTSRWVNSNRMCIRAIIVTIEQQRFKMSPELISATNWDPWPVLQTQFKPTCNLSTKKHSPKI